MSNMEKPPIGLRFQPSDKEKIAYLLQKVTGKPLPCKDFVSVRTVDLYSTEEPWDIFQKSWNRENHFFTKLRKVREGEADSEKCCRDIGQGKWESMSPKIRIRDARNRLVGFLKNYKYKNAENANQDGKWLLKEYTLTDEFVCYAKDEYLDYTFCTMQKDAGGYRPNKNVGNVHDIESFFDGVLSNESLEGSSGMIDPPESSGVKKRKVEDTGSGIQQMQ